MPAFRFSACRAFRPALSILLCALTGAAAAQPTIYLRAGVVLPDSARLVLEEVMAEAGVAQARVTSTHRLPEDQVRVMYGYLQRNGIAAAKALYDREGDAVINVYEAYQHEPREQVLTLMLEELHRQLPSAFARKKLMHLHPCYHTFDVAMGSIPVSRHRAFIEAARQHPRVHRFLGPDQGEREAFHLEVPRSGECPIETLPEGDEEESEGGGRG